jgi:hypothetical protein
MKFSIIRKSIVVLIILLPLIADLGCKKQTRCGCGKDVVFPYSDQDANVFWTADYETVFFYGKLDGSTNYFCNPGKWTDFLKSFSSGQDLLVTGDAYYDCTYLMNNSSQGYATTAPIYQVNVTNLKKNNYAKK